MGKHQHSLATRMVLGTVKGAAKGTAKVGKAMFTPTYVGGNKHNAQVTADAGRRRMALAKEMERLGANPHNVQLMKEKALRQQGKVR